MKTIKFLGTAGARFVVMKQLRASGGLWLDWEGTQVLIDPGPGTLVKALSSRPKLEPEKLSGIILTHRHLDHSADINIMIEAMTEGGFKKRGKIFAPPEALEEDPVILKYLREFVEEIVPLKEGGNYQLESLRFDTPLKHIHGGETYGLNFYDKKELILSIIVDTKFMPEILKAYRGKYLVINTVRFVPKEGLDHLNVGDVEKILQAIKPEVAILTHFGMTMLKAKPQEVAEGLSQKTGLKVLAAYDGMRFEIGDW